MKFGRIGNIRKSKDFERSLPVHKAFGDICLAYQLHMRDELVDVKKRKDELDQLVVKSMAQLENEKKRREMVEKRLEEVEQLSEERKVKLEELQSENDKLGQCMCLIQGYRIDFKAGYMGVPIGIIRLTRGCISRWYFQYTIIIISYLLQAIITPCAHAQQG